MTVRASSTSSAPVLISSRSSRLPHGSATGRCRHWRVLGLARGRIEALLEGWYVHDWQADHFTRGAYSYVPVGALDAVATLAQPVDDTLFLAGEATDSSGHTGTVHGTLATGQRAARQVLARVGHG
jgi:hypothetical protein